MTSITPAGATRATMAWWAVPAAACGICANLAVAANQPDTGAARWKVRATLTAGEVPGGEIVDVEASGRVTDVNDVLDFNCSVVLNAAELEPIAAAVAQAQPARWRARYFPPENPQGADELQMVLSLDRGNAGGPADAQVTRWMIATYRDAPADAVALWNAVWRAGRLCMARK